MSGSRYTRSIVQHARSRRALAGGVATAALLDEGIHVTQRGLLYVSTAHGPTELEETRAALARSAATFAQSMLTTGGRARV